MTQSDKPLDNLEQANQRIAELEQELADRNELLKSTHHRVKNNLQVISSLLSLQSNYIKDNEAREKFTKCRNRVAAIGLVHEELHRNRDYTGLEISSYLKKLIDQLKMTQPKSAFLSASYSGPEYGLGISKVIPLGLLVNELVSNVFQHAFDDHQKGNLDISLELSGDQLELKVKDNGKGLPEGFDPDISGNLGMGLVTSLAQQLQGKLEVSTEEGTEFKITFPADDN